MSRVARRKNKGRVLNGLLLLDKPAGESSNRVLQKVKRIFNAAKAGHTGTLDPLATGLLVICFGRTTKISDYLLAADKKYRVVLKLGVTTDTADADGEILEQRDTSKITEDQILQQAASLTGGIKQIPPMYSALKHQGLRLYELARKGIEVERVPRKVEIYSFEVIEYHGLPLDKDEGRLKLKDILDQLAEQGFSAVEQILLPTDHALQDWPAISIDENQMVDIRNGHAMCLPNLPAEGQVRIYDADQKFYGIGTMREDGRMAPKPLN